MITKDLVAQMRDMGYESFPSWIKVESRWKTMLRSYKKTVDHNNKSGNDKRSCLFYSELNNLFGFKPNVKPHATLSSSGIGDSSRAGTKRGHVEIDENTGGDSEVSSSSKGLPPKKKKKEYISQATKSTNSMLMWLEAYEERKVEREAARAANQEKMHLQKMDLFQKILEKM